MEKLVSNCITLNNGAVMPIVGFGTYLIQDKDLIKKLVKAAVKIGYRHIDTASVYHNEDAIGEALQEIFADKEYNVSRKDMWITTKLSPRDQGYTNALEAFEKSLKRLKLDYVDLYLIHWPGTGGIDVTSELNKENRIGSWKALEKIYNDKKARSIGVSNYHIKHLQELKEYATIMPAVNQCEFHPLHYTKDLVDYTRSLGIAFEAYSSLGTGKIVDGSFAFSEISEVAKNHGATVAQVLLRWGIQQGAIVLPKASSESRLQENFNCQNFELTEEEMAQINSISDKVSKSFCWDPSVVR